VGIDIYFDIQVEADDWRKCTCRLHEYGHQKLRHVISGDEENQPFNNEYVIDCDSHTDPSGVRLNPEEWEEGLWTFDFVMRQDVTCTDSDGARTVSGSMSFDRQFSFYYWHPDKVVPAE
jgi:hypothetical protein